MSKIKTYEHDGVSYEVPEWVNFITCDGKQTDSNSFPVIGWINKPEDHGSYTNRCNYQDSSGGRRYALDEVAPKVVEGAFIVEV
jgi:hypothetical protein